MVNLRRSLCFYGNIQYNALMTKVARSHQGFSHLIVPVLVVLVVVAIGGFLLTRPKDKKDGPQDGKTTISDQTKPKTASPTPAAVEADVALQNFGIASFESIEVSKNALREYTSKGLKGFYVFGDVLSGGRKNPNFEFAAMKKGTPVIAAIDGYIVDVKEQADSKDYEVFLQPKEGSQWVLGYDHLVNVKVQRGSTVKVGDTLGEPAVENNGQYRFEFQVNKGINNDVTHVCPSTLLAASVKDKWTADLLAMQKKWETVSGYDLYNETTQNPVGCLYKTLTPAEAEGR